MKTFTCPQCGRKEAQPDHVTECWCIQHAKPQQMKEVTRVRNEQ